MFYNIEAVLDFYFHRNKFVLSRRITPFLFFLQLKFRFFSSKFKFQKEK